MYRFFNNLSIKGKLICTSVLCAVVVGGFVILFFPYNQRMQIRDQALEKTLAIALMTADNLAASILFQDQTTAAEILEVLAANPDLLFAVVRSANGAEFVRTGTMQEPPNTDGADPGMQSAPRIIGSMAVTTVPIRKQSDTVGWLSLGLSIEKAQAEMELVTFTALMVGAALALIIIFFSVLVANAITRPIRQVIAASEQIARGNFSGTLAVRSRDEVGMLAESFNSMSSRLQESILKLSLSEERYRLNFDNVSDVIFSLDKKLHITSMSPSMEQLTGYWPEELMGQQFQKVRLLSPEHTRKALQDIRKLLRGARIKAVEYDMFTKAGEHKFIEVNAAPLFDKDGRADSFVGSIRDITERKRSEEEIRTARDFFRQVIDASPDGIAVCDTSGSIISINKALSRLYRCAQDMFLGRHIAELVGGDTMPPELRQKVLAAMEELYERGSALFTSIRTTADGGQLEFENHVSRVRDHGGAPLAGVAIIRDITDKKRLEQQLRQSQKMEAVGTLAGGIAHDFNNILTAIIGYSELVLTYAEGNDKITDCVERVLKSGMRARDLVRQILAFSRSGEQERKPVRVAQVLQDSLKLLRASIPTTVDMQLGVEDAKVTVLADETQLHQVIMNLCTNAAQAMAETGGRLELRLSPLELSPTDITFYEGLTPGPYVKLVVSDTGQGISRNIIDKIFDPFFTTKEVGKGTGLGLSVVHGIVSSLGGAIKVYSEEGRGTTFHVLLPRHQAASTGEPEAVRDGGIAQGSGRLLVVDDEEMLAELGRITLQSAGYSVVAVNSPRAALEAFEAEKHDFSLVITDYTMPGMTGLELSKKLLALRPDIPIILCSGYAEAVSAEQAKAAGIRAFIMKPMNKKQMSETIRMVLGQS